MLSRIQSSWLWTVFDLFFFVVCTLLYKKVLWKVGEKLSKLLLGKSPRRAETNPKIATMLGIGKFFSGRKSHKFSSCIAVHWNPLLPWAHLETCSGASGSQLPGQGKANLHKFYGLGGLWGHHGSFNCHLTKLWPQASSLYFLSRLSSMARRCCGQSWKAQTSQSTFFTEISDNMKHHSCS